MSSDKPSILFLCHSASRNGASILLLQTLRWLRHNTNYTLHVVCCDRGPLLKDFRAVAFTRVLRNPAAFLCVLSLAWGRSMHVAIQTIMLRLMLVGVPYDLVYANTVATWPQVAALCKRPQRLLWHIHELPYALSLLIGSTKAAQLFPKATRFIAVSKPTAEALTRAFDVPVERIDAIHGFVATDELPAHERQQRREHVLAALHWPADAFVVGACGGLGWRKGSDLFLQIARHCLAGINGKRIRFMWVGGSATDPEAMQFAMDAQKMNVDNYCVHVPSTSEVLDHYCSMDAFALTSREDPYPLVMLEAGMQGVPTVCFANAGGASEYVGDDAGIVVPYLDVVAFSAALQRLRDEPALRALMGEAAKRKVLHHHSEAHLAPQLLHSIERSLSTETALPGKYAHVRH
jgi:glycosyltransferase involved in cell wall biosynthesis